ncbi:MAG: FHA domain-containing protein [Chromatiales bacterium]|jgi:type II secretory pathway predicted ATPase ExeA|nr:FHA domain-containing protein [Chromatiales bacterium]
MYDSQRGLESQPFEQQFDARFFFRGFQHASALSFLNRALESGETAIAITGAPGTGKRATLEYFLRESPDQLRSGRVDEVPEGAHEFLKAILHAFGFGPVEAERGELRNLLSVFLVQAQHEGQSVLLHIDDPGQISAEVSEELIWLAGEKSRAGGLRIILTGDVALDALLDAPRLEPLANKFRLRHRLDPLSARETHDYLHFRLAAAGCGSPGKVLSSTIATAIYASTGGLPAQINQISAALLDASSAKGGKLLDLDLVRSVAADLGMAGTGMAALDSRVVVSLEGETFLDVPLGRDKLLIGRHSFNDVCLRDSSVSRHHSILVPDGGVWVIVDLNSTNGTMVNGKSVRQRVLANDDCISIGRFQLVYEGGPSGDPAQPPDEADFRSTVVLDDDPDLIS